MQKAWTSRSFLDLEDAGADALAAMLADAMTEKRRVRNGQKGVVMPTPLSRGVCSGWCLRKTRPARV